MPFSINGSKKWKTLVQSSSILKSSKIYKNTTEETTSWPSSKHSFLSEKLTKSRERNLRIFFRQWTVITAVQLKWASCLRFTRRILVTMISHRFSTLSTRLIWTNPVQLILTSFWSPCPTGKAYLKRSTWKRLLTTLIPIKRGTWRRMSWDKFWKDVRRRNSNLFQKSWTRMETRKSQSRNSSTI